MSVRKDLEIAVVDRIKALIADFQRVERVTTPGAVNIKGRGSPLALVFYTSRKKLEEFPYGQEVRVKFRLFFRVLVFKNAAGPGMTEAADAVDALVDALETALVGYEPVLTGADTVFPILPEDDEYFDLETGACGADTGWSIDVQTTYTPT